MSDILSPQGFEPNDPLQDTDVQEVYQPGSLGIRRNKQVTLATQKIYHQKLASFTPNNIMESDGTGNPRTTSISTTSLGQSITDTNTNTNELADKINQGVKTTDTPTFPEATIGGHAVGAELSQNRIDIDSNDVDISNLETRMDNTETATGTNTTNIGTNDSDILALEEKTPQSYKTTDQVIFKRIDLTTLYILGLAVNGGLALSGSDLALFTNGANDIAIYTDGTLAMRIDKTTQDITMPKNLTVATVDTGQGPNELYDMNQNVKTTNDVVFNKVRSDTTFNIGGIEGYSPSGTTIVLQGGSGQPGDFHMAIKGGIITSVTYFP